MLKSESGKSGRGTRGVLALTVSNLLVKAAGLLFKIPMNYAVGDAGMGYYNAAYSVYALLYTLTTAGIPVALSVMIAEQRARNSPIGAEQTYRRALLLMLSAGGAGCALMWAGASPLASLIRSPGSAPAIRAAAPALLFICLSGAARGWFQGCGNMTPTAFSQLAEAFGKLVCGIGGALYAVRRGLPTPVTAAYAAAGLSAGSFLGMAYLLTARRLGSGRMTGRDSSSEGRIPLGQTLRDLGQIALPVTLSASVMSLSSAMDTLSVQRILRSMGATAEEAAARFGNYTSLAVPMFNLPPALVYPFAYALVPAAASALASGRRDEAAERIRDAMGTAAFIGIPCACGLAALADPILCLLFRETSAHAAAPLLTVLAPASFLVCLTAVTNAGLQASGGQRLTVASMAAGAAVKWASGELLLVRFGILGAPLSTLAGYLAVTGLNLAFLRKRTGASLPADRLRRYLLGGVVCAWAAVRIDRLLIPVLGPRTAVLCGIFAAVPVYGLVLLAAGEFIGKDLSLLRIPVKRTRGIGIKRKGIGS